MAATDPAINALLGSVPFRFGKAEPDKTHRNRVIAVIAVNTVGLKSD